MEVRRHHFTVRHHRTNLVDAKRLVTQLGELPEMRENLTPVATNGAQFA